MRDAQAGTQSRNLEEGTEEETMEECFLLACFPWIPLSINSPITNQGTALRELPTGNPLEASIS